MAVFLFRLFPGWRCCGLWLAWLLGCPGAVLAQHQWANSFNPAGLGGSIAGQAMARDQAGNLYLTGVFSGNVQLGAHWLRTSDSFEAAFVAKLSPAGNWQWARALPADSAGSGGESLAVDATGGLYLTGYHAGRLPVATSPAQVLAGPVGTSRQHFIARLDTAGRWEWAQALTTRTPSLVATDAAGAAYVNGGPAAANATVAALAGKLSRSGRWQWLAPAPVGTHPEVLALAVSPAGRLHLAGSFHAQPVVAPWDSQDIPRTKLARPFVGRLSPTGRWEWTATAQPFSALDFRSAGTALRLGPDGAVFVAGRYHSALRFATGPGRATVLPGQPRTTQAFVARLSATGAWQWATPVTSTSTNRSTFERSGQGEVQVTGLDLDAAGQLCLTGSFATVATFPTQPVPTRLSGSGPFVAWLSPRGQWVSVATPTAGDTILIIPQALVAVGAGRANLLCRLYNSGSGFVMGMFRVDQSHPQHWALRAQADVFSRSSVQAVAYAGHGELAVAGSFSGRLEVGGTTYRSNSSHLLVGVLGTQGAWRWQQVKEFPGGVSVRSLLADTSGRLYVLGLYQSQSPGGFRLDSSRAETTLVRLPQEDSPRDGSGWFIAQLGRDGEWRWARRLGTATPDAWAGGGKDAALAVDPAGHAWVTVVTDSLRAWGPSGVQVSLQRWDAEGRLQETRPLARGSLRVEHLSGGLNGELYFGGRYTDSASILVRPAYVRLRTHQPESDETFVGRLMPGQTGEWALSTGLGFEMMALSPGPEGGLWLGGGLTQDTVRVPTLPAPTVLTRIPGANYAGAIGRLDAQGSWRWAQRVGSSHRDYVLALATDRAGRLHLAGAFDDSTLTVDTRPAVTRLRHASGDQQLFVAQLAPAGQWLAARTLPVGLSSNPFAMATGPTGQLYVGGEMPYPFSFDTPAGTTSSMAEQPAFNMGVAASLPPWSSALALPALRALQPVRGRPGTQVRLQGAHLAGVSRVRVGGVAAGVVVESDEQLLVTVPAGAGPGPVRIDVVTPGGQATAPQQFRIRR